MPCHESEESQPAIQMNINRREMRKPKRKIKNGMHTERDCIFLERKTWA